MGTQIHQLDAAQSFNGGWFVYDDALGTTYKLSWGDLVNKIITDHILEGSNISLTKSGNTVTISSTSGSGGGGDYTPGSGIDISAEDVISIELSELAQSQGLAPQNLFLTENSSGTINKIYFGTVMYYILNTGLVQGSYITLEQQTAQDGSPAMKISANVPDWIFTSSEPETYKGGDFWVHTESANLGQIDKYDSTTYQWVTQGSFAGRDGKSATVDVGTVTTGAAGTNASVNNSGTTSDAVFNFTIPRGADGTNGYSVSFASAPITGGHSVTISSTDPNVTDETFNIMDGTEVIQATSDNRSATLLAASWAGDSAPYTQTVSVLGMTASVVPVIGLSVSSTVETGIEEQKQWSYVTKAVSGADSITFSCYKTKPTVDLTINIKAV